MPLLLEGPGQVWLKNVKFAPLRVRRAPISAASN